MYIASVFVKRPMLPPCAVDGRSRSPLYYYYEDRTYPQINRKSGNVSVGWYLPLVTGL